MHWYSFISLIVFSIADSFLLWVFTAKKEKTALKSSIVSLIFLWLIFITSYIFKFYIPDITYVLVIIALFSHSYFGYYLNFYNKLKNFDRIQHAFGSFSFAVFSYFLLSNFFEYGGSKLFRSFYIFLLGISTGMLYEIIEFLTDLKHEKKLQRGLKDTDIDMISDIIGSVFASILAYLTFL